MTPPLRLHPRASCTGVLAAIAIALATEPAAGQDHTPTPEGVVHNLGQAQFSPYVGRDFPMRR